MKSRTPLLDYLSKMSDSMFLTPTYKLHMTAVLISLVLLFIAGIIFKDVG